MLDRFLSKYRTVGGCPIANKHNELIMSYNYNTIIYYIITVVNPISIVYGRNIMIYLTLIEPRSKPLYSCSGRGPL